MVIVIIVIFFCLIFLGTHFGSTKGEVGERRVGRILNKVPKEEYLIINNLLLRSTLHNTTQIDHLVISEYGIFVIETKNYKGWILGGENSEHWTQVIFRRKYKFLNPIIQNYGHIRVLRSILRNYGNIPIISIVAFSRRAKLKVRVSSIVIYWDQILPFIASFKGKCIDEDIKTEIYKLLTESNLQSREDLREHVRNVKLNKKKSKIAVSSGKCPRCGGDLVRRKGKYGSFYGCSRYPKCRYTLSKY